MVEENGNVINDRNFQVMGLMLGEFVDEYTVNVIDVFAMPQSGTVTYFKLRVLFTAFVIMKVLPYNKGSPTLDVSSVGRFFV